MSKLIFNWLNEDVGLSKHIVSFEDDFRDGYLLGELLYRYNQQDDFGQFQTKFTPDARIKNYCLLEPTIRRLGLDFNFKLAFDIMNGKHGVTRALLAELRPLLERIQKNSEPPIAPEGQRGQIMRVMKPGNERFDLSMSAAFEKSVRVHMDNPTEVILQDTVGAKFQAIGRASDAMAADGDNYDAWYAASERQRKREVFEHRKKHEQEFQKAWDLLNVEQWKKNQATSKARKDKEAYNVMAFEDRKSAHFAQAMEEAKKDIAAGISAFDKRLEKEVFREDETLQETLGITLKKTVRGGDGSGLPELEYMNQRYLDEGLNLALKTMKEHHKEEIARQVTHDRRRRKFVRMRENFHSQSLQHTAQTEIVEQLKTQCKVELQESDLRSKVLARTSVMSENRALREQKVVEVVEEIAKGRGEWLEQLATREKEWAVPSQIEALHTRADTLQTAKQSANRYRNEQFIGETIDRLLDLADWVVTSRHVGLYHHAVVQPKPAEGEEDAAADAEAPVRVASGSGLPEAEEAELEKALLPWHLWSDIKGVFVSGAPMAEAIMEPYETNVSVELPHSHSEKPLGVDLPWLTSSTFQAHIALAPPGSLEAEILRLQDSMAAEAAAKEADAAADAAADAEGEGEKKEEDAAAAAEAEPAPAPAPVSRALVPALATGEEVPPSRALSEILASEDSSRFFAAVAEGAPAGAQEGVDFDQPPAGVEVPPSNLPQDPGAEDYREGMMVTPDWLYTCPSKYLLGEVLVAAGCAAEPLPEDPPCKLDVSTVPVRLAITGVSDAARQALSGALKEANPDLRIINLEALVHKAAQVAEEVLGREEQEQEQEQGEKGRSEEEKTAVQVQSFLAAGKAVPDFLYVKLLVAAIAATLPPAKHVPTPEEAYEQQLLDNDKTEKALALEAAERAAEEAETAARHPGFILEDFPVTRKQAVMLCEAISGIDYESKRPQPADKASAFAKAQPATYQPSCYDPAKCGLNRVVHLDTGDAKALSGARGRARVDLHTGSIVEVGQSDSDQLQQLYTPLRPLHTASLEYASAGAEQDSLLAFASHLQMLSQYGVSEWEGDYKSLEDAVRAAVNDAMTSYFPSPSGEESAAPEGEGGQVQETDAPAGEGEGEAPVDDAQTDEAAADADANAAPAPVPAPAALQAPTPVQLPQGVAKYLVGTWQAVEAKCLDRTRAFFAALRDSRYEMLQRRRVVHDVVYKYLVARDNRQEVFESFRDGFNAVSWENRFDADFINELNLRTLELGKELWTLCDTRNETCAGVLKKFLSDGEVTLLAHMCRAEGAAVLQSEYERFATSLHVLQDFCRGVANYDSQEGEGVPLEQCLEPEAPTLEAALAAAAAAGGKKDAKKDKGKGGKGGAAEAEVNRAVYPPILLPIETLKTLPEAKEEEEEDPKAKGKKDAKKGKGGAADEAADPLSMMIAAVTSVAADYTKDGGFTVQRALFPDQEALCVALETSVWHEAARLHHAISLIKTTVDQQSQWLSDCEKSLGLVMGQVLRERHYREYTQVDRLLDMVHEVVRRGEPIREVWELSPDSIVVHQNRLVVPAPLSFPEPAIEAFALNTLNEQQLAGLRAWADMCRHRVCDGVAGEEVLLSEDVEAMLQRAANEIGPYASVKHTTFDNPFIEDEMDRLTLIVKVVRCTDLPNLDSSAKGSGVSDPFVRVFFQEQRKKTKVVDNNLSPEYNQALEFEWKIEPGEGADEDFAIIMCEAFDMDFRQPPESIGTARLDLSENGLKERILEAYKAPKGSDEAVVKIDPIPILSSFGEQTEQGSITLELSVKDLNTEDELIRHSALIGPHLPDGWKKGAVFDQIKSLLAPAVPLNGKPPSCKEFNGTHSVEVYKKAVDLNSAPLDEEAREAAKPFKGV